MNQNGMNNYWIKIKEWLENNAPDTLDSLNRPAEQNELDSFSEMPEDWYELYRAHNGCENSLIYGMTFYGLNQVQMELESKQSSSGETEPLKYVDKGIKSSNIHNSRWIPLFHDYGESQLLVDLDPEENGFYGQVIYIDYAFQVAILVAESIKELFTQFAEDLQNGKYFHHPEAVADGVEFLTCEKEMHIINWYTTEKWAYINELIK